jgi:hypothetical protein
VRKLRSKLQHASPDWHYIHTHFGVGYRFAAERAGEEPLESAPAAAAASASGPAPPATPESPRAGAGAGARAGATVRNLHAVM